MLGDSQTDLPDTQNFIKISPDVLEEFGNKLRYTRNLLHYINITLIYIMAFYIVIITLLYYSCWRLDGIILISSQWT